MPDSTTKQSAKTFRDLLVWQKAHALVLAVYRATQAFPREETYGLSSQIRRATVSIPANIAEGFPKRTVAEKRRFLEIAKGSLEEVRYYVILALDLRYIDEATLQTSLEEVSRLLYRSSQNLTAAPKQTH